MKLVCAGLCDVVDLGCSIAPLIDCIGKSVDGHFCDRIQPENQIGRQSAVQIRQRIVGFQAIDDVAIREGRQPIEFDVAVPICAADEIVAAAGSVDEGAGGKLQGVGQIAARIGQVLQCRCTQIRRCVCVSRN